MSPAAHLATTNFFVGDIQGGLGPFLAIWLAQAAHWSPRRIGSISTTVGIASLLLNGPAGVWADHSRRPRLLLALSCTAILFGTLLLFQARGVMFVVAAQLLAAAGGTLVVPALTVLTLGIVGKGAFPRQQGRNQAFNHAGILTAAILVATARHRLGNAVAFLVLGGMAVAAIISVLVTPSRLWNRRRARGWKEEDTDDTESSHPLLAVLANRRLLVLAASLSLFNLSNGSMLSLLCQRLVGAGYDATRWTALYVVVAQLTMIPAALWAGSLADKRGRRRLLLIASLALITRALLTAFIHAPLWLVPAEMLDGVGSGLLGVAVPVLVADLTWGSGRTQTALGAVNTLQGVGGALSGIFGGLLVEEGGWTGGLLALALPAAAAFGLGLWLEETRTLERPYLPKSPQRTEGT